jgi:hypothetical protein
VCGGSLQNSLDDPGWVKCFSCSRSFDPQTLVDQTAAAPGIADPDGTGMSVSEANRRTEEERRLKDAQSQGGQRTYVRRVLH